MQIGDENMTCDQLKTEIDHMSALIAQAEEYSGETTATSNALTAGATSATVGASMLPTLSSSLAVIPGVGALAALPGVFAPTRAAQQMQAQQAEASEEQRKQNLVRDFNQKKCIVAAAR
ncbi:MAG TPA: hypothetical protein VMF32_05790 [Xanthobacteraceae bacterium]|nr:hypothetical protein [Xanthobacteraceae bacterium]